MKYLLDTNTCIRYLNGRAPQLRVKLAATPLSEIAVSSITKAEMFYRLCKESDTRAIFEKTVGVFERLKHYPV